MSVKARNALLWVLVAAYAIGIFLLSSSSSPPSGGIGFPMKDKLAHFAIYFIFGTMLYRASYESEVHRPWMFSSALGVSYAFSDEFHQLFVPGRSCDPLDFAVDALAVLAATALYQRKSYKP